jgi:putative ABC transport system ATP-binding protein
MQPNIQLKKVTKIYKMGSIGITALQDISLDVCQGEFIVLLGPSGSGKTTLLNLIGGLDSVTSGEIIINGIDITKYNKGELTNYRRTQIGFIFQFFNLIPTLTAIENVEFASELAGNQKVAKELLEDVGLRSRINHFPSELSGGENQRVAIARALATDPCLLLCDEPTGSLDYETGKRIFKLLRILNHNQNKTVVVVTHNAPVGDIADRVVRMRDGKIVNILENPNPLDPDKLEW